MTIWILNWDILSLERPHNYSHLAKYEASRKSGPPATVLESSQA